jgi:hypothetical protein
VIQYNYDCINSKPLILKNRGAETKFRKVKEKGHDLYEIEVVEYIKEALIFQFYLVFNIHKIIHNFIPVTFL